MTKFSVGIFIEGSWDKEVRLDDVSSKRDGVSSWSCSFAFGVVDCVFGHHFDRGSRGSWVREVRPDELSSKKEWSCALEVG